jgi:hypothetical protein
MAERGIDARFTLTDRYPNLPAFREASSESGGRIGFVAEPVDARAVPRGLPGFRTMFNAFHHFRPADARGILRDAVRARRPIAIFEFPLDTLRTFPPLLLLPLFVLATTPFVRPFRWKRLLWTYVVPLVPLTYAWDPIVSQLRQYSSDDLRRMTEGLEEFVWQAGDVPTPRGGRVTYLVGHPATSSP